MMVLYYVDHSMLWIWHMFVAQMDSSARINGGSLRQGKDPQKRSFFE